MSTDNIKELRLSLGISQEKLAEMVEVSTRTIQRMESTGTVSKVTLDKIKSAFDNYVHPPKELPTITTYKLDKVKLLACYSKMDLFLSKNKNIEPIAIYSSYILSPLGALGVALGYYPAFILMFFGFLGFSIALGFNGSNKHSLALRLHVKAQKSFLKHYDHYKDKWCVINDQTVFLNDLKLVGSSVKACASSLHTFGPDEKAPAYEEVCDVRPKNNPNMNFFCPDDTQLIRVFVDDKFNYVVYTSLLWPRKGCVKCENIVLNKLQLKAELAEGFPALYKLVNA